MIDMETMNYCNTCGRVYSGQLRFCLFCGEKYPLSNFDFVQCITNHLLLQQKPHKNRDFQKKKEATTMQVSYKGFTGELEKLELTHYGDNRYALSIYDSEKQVTHSFTGVKMGDMKFLEAEVCFR